MIGDIPHAAFQRTWHLTRTINHADGTVAHFDGTAALNAAWEYSETGTLRMGAQSFGAARKYLWAPIDGGFEIRFDDGRAFHTMRFAGAQDDHWCDPDTYRVSYDLSAFPTWSAQWRVTGPRKDYEMRSLYSLIVDM